MAIGLGYKTFTFDGENSGDYGIYITGEAVYDAPIRVVDKISVPGRNGDILLDQGRFENIEVTYPAGAFGASQSEFAARIRSLRNMLATRWAYCRLEDEYHPDEYRLASYKSGLDVDPVSFQRAGEFSITFDCKPQRFLTSGETASTFTADGSITNPTLFAAKPLLIVTGYGTLGIGDYSLIIAGDDATQEIYIDCDTMEAWSVVGGSMLPMNDHIQNAGSPFPALEPGENGIALDTTMSQVIITPRWWII